MQARARPLVGIGAVVSLEAVAAWLAFQTERAGTPSFWLLATIPNLVIALVALARARRDGVLGEWMTPQSGDLGLGGIVGAALFGAAYLFAKVVCPPESAREIWLVRVYLQLGDPGDLRAHTTLLLLAIVAAAAAEEIVWRGLVGSLFAEALGSRWAWVAQALAWSVAYLPTLLALSPAPHVYNPLLPIAALGAGIVLGGLTRYFGRLPPAIVAHAIFDCAILWMFRLWGESV